ncbi:hypothetical protein IPJ72_07380 [Candidatus Peregrinibacteria bacterium]|nr:MAG: hypothetical protein IPJ72_07380 [Candidatus Peregrinibacteria bacterium]
MYQSVLQKMGLSADEVSLYVALLRMGPQPASVVARHLHHNRTTVLHQLKELVQQGFVQANWRGRTQYFTAKSPDTILDVLSEKKRSTVQQIEETMQQFSAIMPELNTLARTDVRLPKVTLYEGTDELKHMYKDTLTSDTEILCLSSVKDLWDLFGEQYDQWYVNKRVKSNIPVRYLAQDNPIERDEMKKNSRLLRESRLIKASLFSIANEINIYDGKVSIITLKNERIGILIDSQEVYQSMKVIFEMLWQQGNK